MTTIRDVAARAQVSVATVSRVMNNHPSVGPAIRRVVLEAIEALHYQPSAIARTLRTARTRTLGLLLSDMRSFEVVVPAIWGAEAVAHAHGYSLVVANWRHEETVVEQHLCSLLERRVDGLLCGPAVSVEAVHRLAQRAGVPAVMYGRPSMDGPLPATVVSLAAALEEAIDDLVQLGHRRIGTIGRAVDLREGRTGLVREIRRALRDRGVETDVVLDLTAASPAECTRLVRETVADGPSPTAFLVLAPFLAPATIAGIRAAGATIPRDVSLIAVGDSEWAPVVDPPLSVVVVDWNAHLEAATRLLIELIEHGRDRPTSVIEHGGQYIRRGSVQPPPNRLHKRSGIATPGGGHEAAG